MVYSVFHTLKDGGEKAKELSQGGQLPMDVHFINVNRPGRIPNWQLSQITAHAMRRNHERRRGLEVQSTRAQPLPASVDRSRGARSQRTDQGSEQSRPISSNDLEPRPQLLLKHAITANARTKATPTPGDERAHPSLLCSAPQRLSKHGSSPEKLSGDAPADPCGCPECRAEALALAACSTDSVFGGLRTDPFLRYPIESQDYFPAVIDHCREIIAPSPAFFELFMTHDVLFEAIITWVLCTYLLHTPELKKAMLYHYGGSLSKIRERLLFPGSTRKAVMAAISNLAGVCAYFEDDTSFNMHRNALRYLGQFRDDEDMRDRDIRASAKRPSSFHDALSYAQPRRKGKAGLPEDRSSFLTMGLSSSREPVYPNLPFSTELSARLSRVCEGFRELALRRILSIQVIERLAMERSQIVRLASRATRDREDSRALREKLTPIERLIWLGFSVFHLYTATYQLDRQEMAEAFLECSRKMARGSQLENDCLLWGGCVVTATKEIEGCSLAKGEAVTKTLLTRFKMSIEEMNGVAQRFLWNESMSSCLTAALRHRFIAVSKIEETAEWRTWL
ncbi:uncharacterized protein PV07_10465 [Cladophialophora immunda]|uniref:Transcription factor domain-containing protein n=1 Tax=Cladophialophora immunda TaxID=569365 RepID=A0A0D2AIP2_9EURO|nr:uncharacterized protein PV07_10465 [Cladophialophora immunda]KIW24772.1 hypothetical protein PV07_10465 [Cladophialophora immunda]OQU97715.1 hypothetical protein CLAIMM_03605 [Cladophialophora immunda]